MNARIAHLFVEHGGAVQRLLAPTPSVPGAKHSGGARRAPLEEQQPVRATMADRLGDRFLRLAAPRAPAVGLGIDVATPTAWRHLIAAATKTLEGARRPRPHRPLEIP